MHERRNETNINLTDLSMDKMAAVSQTIFSDAFPWMKSFFIVIKI